MSHAIIDNEQNKPVTCPVCKGEGCVDMRDDADDEADDVLCDMCDGHGEYIPAVVYNLKEASMLIEQQLLLDFDCEFTVKKN